jgi:hypothetical protein
MASMRKESRLRNKYSVDQYQMHNSWDCILKTYLMLELSLCEIVYFHNHICAMSKLIWRISHEIHENKKKANIFLKQSGIEP